MKEKREKILFKYKGPVHRFEHLITNKWEAATLAVSPEKALSNLKFKAKREFNYSVNAKLILDKNCLMEV